MIEPKVCCTKLAFKLMCHLCLDLDFVPAALAERIHRQVAKLRRAIEEDQRLLMHWAEEKVALANSLVSLLQLHSAQSARDLAGLEAELQAEAAAEGEMVEYMSSEEMKRYRLQELERERQDKASSDHPKRTPCSRPSSCMGHAAGAALDISS
eukprot:jgi/Astpho2/2718/Aster-x0123